MAFDISQYSPQDLTGYWNNLMGQSGGNEQNAAELLYNKAKSLGANYSDLLSFGKTVNPTFDPQWLQNSIYQVNNKTPNTWNSAMLQQSPLGAQLFAGQMSTPTYDAAIAAAQAKRGVVNNTGHSLVNPMEHNNQDYNQDLQDHGLHTMFTTGPGWQGRLSSQLQNRSQSGLGLGSGFSNTPTTPNTFPSVNTVGGTNLNSSNSGDSFTSGSTVNTSLPTYPQTLPNLNNYRGATYFNPQQNQYVSGGGLTSGY